MRLGLTAFLAMAIAPMPNFAVASPAVSLPSFVCQMDLQGPITLAETPQGAVPLIVWSDPAIDLGDTSAQALCEVVSQQLQAFQDQGQLHYITTGRVNGQLVACVAATAGGRCQGTLFSLQATSRPRAALQQVLRVRIPEGGPIDETGSRLYVNIERYLNGEYPGAVSRDSPDAALEQDP